jgi:hypothetical protein
MIEKRIFNRKAVKVKVVCSSVRNPGNRKTAECIDISLDGIGLRSKSPIIGAGGVNVEIRRPFWEKPIRAEGRIVWQADPDSSGERRTGIQFTSMAWTQIRSFMNRYGYPLPRLPRYQDQPLKAD